MTKIYDSKFEIRVEKSLGIEKNTEFRLEYTIAHKYTPDFVDYDNKIIYESKGFFKASDRQKMKAVRKDNPGWRIVMILQSPNNRISKKSKTTYAWWCQKNGFEWVKG